MWFIGRFLVNGVQPPATGEPAKVKVKVRINIHGLFVVNNAHMVELMQGPEESTEPMDTADVTADNTASTDQGDGKEAPAADDKPAPADGKDAEQQAGAEVGTRKKKLVC